MGIIDIMILFVIYLVPAATGWIIGAIVSRFIMIAKEWFSLIELAGLPLPFVMWLLLFAASPFGISSSKSLSNAIAEPIYLGIAYGLLSLLRLLLLKRWPGYTRVAAVAIPCVGVGLSVLIYFLMPSIPE